MKFEQHLNDLGKHGKPFLFYVDFEMKKPRVFPLDSSFPGKILFDFNGFSNTQIKKPNFTVNIIPNPVAFNTYNKAFTFIQQEQRNGNSYLTNLTFKTPLSSNSSLEDIFYAAKAKYKILVPNEFVVFSPESFVRIQDQTISTYPMKGTIDASVKNAETIILNDAKEKAEHFTIVDLLRNDLSMVAKHVRVNRFRYIEKIHAPSRDLLQVSSEITGKLPADYLNNLGSILCTLLPAGSVSGAPKRKTLEIIKKAEQRDRGYYTGVAGIFDGNSLDTFVMIRFISRENGQLYYHSGGGITVNSIAEKEYQEMKDKIYVPSD